MSTAGQDDDMLDIVLPGSQDSSAGTNHHQSTDVTLREEAHVLLLSSSPMSLVGHDNNIVHMLDDEGDGDSISHLSGLLNHDAAVSSGVFNKTPDVMADLHTSTAGVRSTQVKVIAEIESVFEGIADALLAERDEVAITLHARRTIHSENPEGLPQSGRSRNTTIAFPGKSAEEAWKFTVILRLLELIHEAISSGIVITKRDLYYRDPALFGKQSAVDRYVDQIALSFGIPRSLMNVTAAAKGLIAGAAILYRRDGSHVNLAPSNDGTLVPDLVDVLSVQMSVVQWIIVIEKEATFQSIVTSQNWETLQWQGMIITGKGYPDLATRAMLHFLATPTPRNGFCAPPVYGLMDYDPDGLAILSNYKYGSMRSSHDGEALTTPDLRWLGLKSDHILSLEQTHFNQGLMPLTKRDRRKATRMLGQVRMTEDGEESQWRQQLQVMLLVNYKAELQILDANPGALMGLISSSMA